MPDEIPFDERLVQYFASRERDRQAQVEALLARMTKRERLIVREAAVMANVRGGMRAGANMAESKIPADSFVVADTLLACVSMPELYPALYAMSRGKRVSYR